MRPSGLAATLILMLRLYTIVGAYLPDEAEKEIRFEDKLPAPSAEHAFSAWERKHGAKPRLQFHSIEPLV